MEEGKRKRKRKKEKEKEKEKDKEKMRNRSREINNGFLIDITLMFQIQFDSLK